MEKKIDNRMRLKDRILESLIKAIRSIQDYQSQFSPNDSMTSLHLTNEDKLLQRLCEHLDHALLHGLRHINSGYWTIANEFTTKETKLQIKHLTKVVTDLGRGRAWLYSALNDCLLESYMRCFLENQATVRRYYVKEALVLDRERMDLLLTMVQGLEFVVFDLEIDVPYLDLASFMPKTRSLTARSDLEDSDDHVSLSSMESDASSSRSRASSLVESRNAPSLTFSMDTSYSLDEDLPSVQEDHIEERLSCLDIHPDDSMLPIQVVHNNKPRRKKSSSIGPLDSVTKSSWTKTSTPPPQSDINANSSQINVEKCPILTKDNVGEDVVRNSGRKDFSPVKIDCDSSSSTTFGIRPNETRTSDLVTRIPSDLNITEAKSVLPRDVESSTPAEKSDATTEPTNCEQFEDANFADPQDCFDASTGIYDDFYSKSPLEKSNRTLTPCSPLAEGQRESPFVDIVCRNGNYETREMGFGAMCSTGGEIKYLRDDCQVSIDNNMMLYLVLDIFSNQHEKLHKIYVTRIGYVDGDLLPVYLVVSDRGLYVLRRSRNGKYKRLLVVLYTEIDYLSMSVQSQLVHIACVNRRRQFWLCTGNSRLNSALVEDMSTLSGAGKSQPLSILTDATTQRISLKKWIARETRCLTTEVEISGYYLVLWEDLSSLSSQAMKSFHQGWLSYRLVGTEAALPWTENLFTFRDNVLYRYVQENDVLVPEVCVDFSNDECRGCRRCPSSEREHTFELLLSDGTSVWLSAHSQIELEEWLGSLLLVVSQKTPENISAQYSGLVPCCAVVTSGRLYLAHEDVQTNFFRTLGGASLDDVNGLYVQSTTTRTQTFCVVEFDSGNKSVTSRWVLYFPSVYEMDHFVSAVAESWKRIYQVAMPIGVLSDASLSNRCLETVAKQRNALRHFTKLGGGRPLI